MEAAGTIRRPTRSPPRAAPAAPVRRPIASTPGLLIALAAAAGALPAAVSHRARLRDARRRPQPVAARLAGLRTDRRAARARWRSAARSPASPAASRSAPSPSGSTSSFSPGYGFTAIAVALLGRLHPARRRRSPRCSSARSTPAPTAMQRSAGVSSVLVSVIQATVIFACSRSSGAARRGSSRRLRSGLRRDPALERCDLHVTRRSTRRSPPLRLDGHHGRPAAPRRRSAS